MDLPFIIIGAVLGAMALAAIVFIVWAIRRANYLRNLRQRPRQTEQNIYVQLKKREESPGAREVSAPEPIYEALDSLRGTPRTNRFQQATSTDKETEGNDHRGVAAFRDPRMPVRADDGNTNEVDSALETHRESAKREVATQVSDTCDMTSASYNKRVPRVPSTSSISTCSCSSHDAVTERSPPYSVQDSTVTSKQCLRSSERHLSRHRSLQSTLEGFKTFEVRNSFTFPWFQFNIYFESWDTQHTKLDEWCVSFSFFDIF